MSGRVQSFLPAPHQAGDLEGEQRLHVERLKTGRSGDPCVHLLLYTLPLGVVGSSRLWTEKRKRIMTVRSEEQTCSM